MSDGRFKPGKSGNPNGRPPLPSDIKEIRKYSRLEIERVFDKFLTLSKSELSERLRRPDTPALEAILGQIVLKAISGGDHQRLNFLLDRLIGKVKEEVEVNVRKPYVIERRDGTLVELGATEGETDDGDHTT